MSFAEPHPPHINIKQKLASALAGTGLFLMFLSLFGLFAQQSALVLYTSLASITAGVSWFAYEAFAKGLPGIRNDGVLFSSLTNRGLWAWVWGIVITVFYILLYWFPATLGLSAEGDNTGLVALFDPLSHLLKAKPASEWFVYGTLYTLAILVFGLRFIWKYRHNRYQIIRTLSVMFFQLAFAFLIPEFLQKLNYPYNDFKNMWPLNYYFFDGWNVKAMLSSGHLGMFMLLFGILMIFIISPVLTYLYGKRWYCSWVCGCGGLAETAGDPFRHLSDKSLKAWQIERWIIHLVLLFAFIMTAAVIFSFFHNNAQGYWLDKSLFVILIIAILVIILVAVWAVKAFRSKIAYKARLVFSIVSGLVILSMILALASGNSNAFFIDYYKLRSTYGFLVGAAFSGVIGVGFYPLMGSRVWCRFGCPMAAILGIQQKLFSRFRITTNGGQCISCGNCSTYCEMGIDVRAYAQKGQDIVRASCVGCGICAAVCPRGVLRLENASSDILERASRHRNDHVQQ